MLTSFKLIWSFYLVLLDNTLLRNTITEMLFYVILPTPLTLCGNSTHKHTEFDV